jgi:hypothetical protein
VRDIFESFDFHTQIDRLAKSGLLYLVAEKFAWSLPASRCFKEEWGNAA